MPIPALIGAGATVFGSLFGARSTKKTNDSNLRINQMNNEFNERMMRQQQDYNTLMWEKQNNYNDPSAQVNRLKAAGLNPYMMMNGGSAGNAQSMGSTSAASSAGAAPQQAYHPDFQGIPQSILMAHQGKLLKEQYRQQVIDNQTRSARNMKELANLTADVKNKEVQEKLQKTILSYADDMQRVQLEQMSETNRNLRMERMLMEKNLNSFDARNKAEIAKIISETDLNAYNMNEEVGKMLITMEKKLGRKLNKTEKNDIFEALKDQIEYKATSGMTLSSSVATGANKLGIRLKRFIDENFK